MKKAIGILAVLTLLLSLLTSCSSSKSVFLANLRHFAKEPDFSAKMTFHIKELSGKYETKHASLLRNSEFIYDTSLNRKANQSYNTYQWNVTKPTSHTLTFHTLQDFETGRIYFPAKDLFSNQSEYDFFFSKQLQAIADDVLPLNQKLKGKYFDLYEAMQNITGQTIDSQMVTKQAKEIANIEDKVMFNLYEYMNKINKKRFTTDNNVLKLRLNKHDIRSLVRENAKSFYKDEDLLNLVMENKDMNKQDAKQFLEKQMADTNSKLTRFVNNDANKWNIDIALTGDNNKKLKKMFITNNLQTANDRLVFTTDIEFKKYKPVPSIPDRSTVINKESLDKAISDVITSYMSR